MKLTKKDKDYILNHVYGGIEPAFNEDIQQIEEAAEKTTYSFYKGEEEIPLSRPQVIKKIGRSGWLSGICRSAFHFTACRVADDGTEIIFDSSGLFK